MNGVATGRYPSPPARDLNLVTQGQPAGLAKAFIAWVLIDGQDFVDEAGYIYAAEGQARRRAEKAGLNWR